MLKLLHCIKFTSIPHIMQVDLIISSSNNILYRAKFLRNKILQIGVLQIFMEINLNLGLLNASQMLLPTEPLELRYWNRRYVVYIHRHSSLVWGLLCNKYTFSQLNSCNLRILDTVVQDKDRTNVLRVHAVTFLSYCGFFPFKLVNLMQLLQLDQQTVCRQI